MFFRTKSIKGSPLLQLVEAFRNAEGQPRQRVVVSLGDAKLPDKESSLIAQAVSRRLRGETDWFEQDLSAEGAAWVSRILQLVGRSKVALGIGGRRAKPAPEPKEKRNDSGTARSAAARACYDAPVAGYTKPASHGALDGVLVDEIESENVVQLGPQLVALEAWDQLGLTSMLEERGMNPSRIATAKLMVANRLIEPLSEWALIDWSHRTALPELLDIRITKSSKDRLYLTSDDLLTHRVAIETSLRSRERELFDLRRSVILYDVTNTHFEGMCEANPKAKHGKNKQKRNDCRQVAVGVAFDEHGLPLAHEVFPGNVADTKTLIALLERLAPGDCDALKPVVVLDAGFASKENIAMLKERGYSYLINITRGSRAKYAEVFSQECFEELPGRQADRKVEVKVIIDPEDEEGRLVLCRSAQRRLKEEAMVSKAEARFLEEAKALAERIKKGKLKNPSTIERKIGALQKKHPRINRYYRMVHQEGELDIVRDEDKIKDALDLCGDYVLKTDKDMGAVELWELYMTLLKAESGFRMLKGSLGLRPNYHQLEGRVDGHIFISILAYHLLCWVRHRFEVAGDPREWSTIRRLLSTHSLVTTRLPLLNGRILSIRKPSVPDAEQSFVYETLGIDWRRRCPSVKSEIAVPATL